jgi:hypothetical protein
VQLEWCCLKPAHFVVNGDYGIVHDKDQTRSCEITRDRNILDEMYCCGGPVAVHGVHVGCSVTIWLGFAFVERLRVRKTEWMKRAAAAGVLRGNGRINSELENGIFQPSRMIVNAPAAKPRRDVSQVRFFGHSPALRSAAENHSDLRAESHLLRSEYGH